MSKPFKVYSFNQGQLRAEAVRADPPIPVLNSGAIAIPAQPSTDRQGNTKTIRLRAQWPVSAHRFVTDGAEYVGHDNTFDANRVLGMTLNAADADALVNVAVLGYVHESTWNLTPDLPIYLGKDGYMTQTPPTEGFLLSVGVALTPTSAYIDVDVPIFLLED
jgi:hypothetical protein